ncbi:MAG TPA: hypothetical protein VHM23_23415 [Actinomycetota bacterium]|jgi:hypothetical protein|nr:hypothetical protein [Actinomycetota bacterium]
MTGRRRLRLLAGGLAATLALGACGLLPGNDDEPAGSAAAPAPVSEPFDLAGVCPNPVVIQTDWLPESEYGATYNLVGDGYRVDAKKTTVRGPMVVEGKATGVDVEVRSGGPAIDFAKISEQMYKDKGITLGYVNTEQAAQLYAQWPTVSVIAPMEISPGVIMWSPEKHPDWNTMVDIGQTNAKVLVTADDLFPQFLVGTGILRAKQLDTNYDGSPTGFLESGGTIAQGGFATNEPYVYSRELSEWGRPIAFQLVHDTGFEAYTQTFAIRTGDKEKLAPCLRKLVPLIQRSVVEFATKPQRTNDLIIKLVNDYGIDFWHYSPELARFSSAQQLALGIVGNGPDQTIGNFDQVRVNGVLEIVRTIFAGRRQPLKEGLTAQDLATNDFIDLSVGLPAAAGAS